MEQAVENCAQVALIFIDIDRLHPFNHQSGHSLGDKNINEIAREIETASGENTLVIRYGGDEFGVILPEVSLETAREIAEIIRLHRQAFFVEVNGKSVETLTLSLGIAHFPTHASSAQNLLEAADLALLKAKGEGKQGGRWPDGTHYTGRNRVIAIGDFLDDFPEQSARFLRQ